MNTAITDLMFRDTITARMLRRLCEAVSMKQAEFMRTYHVMCHRDPTRARSSFVDNFGRFVHHSSWGTRTNPVVVPPEITTIFGSDGVSWHPSVKHADGTTVIPKGSYAVVTSDPRKPYACMLKTTDPDHVSRYMLTWTAGYPSHVVGQMTDEGKHAAFTHLERQMLAPRKFDDEAEIGRWILRLLNREGTPTP